MIIGQTTLNNLSFDGDYEFETFTSDIKINNNLISAKSVISFSWSKDQKKYQFDLNLKHLKGSTYRKLFNITILMIINLLEKLRSSMSLNKKPHIQ